jgi:hypothetical protein
MSAIIDWQRDVNVDGLMLSVDKIVSRFSQTALQVFSMMKTWSVSGAAAPHTWSNEMANAPAMTELGW